MTASGLAAICVALWLTYGAQFPLGYLRGLAHWGKVIPPEFVMLSASVYLWWRGITLGRRQIPYDDLAGVFYGGILALALLLGMDRLSALLSPAEAFWPVLLFFAIGLSALALVSFERARRQQKEATGVSLALNRYWLATVAGVIGAILLGGLAVAELIAPETLVWLMALLRPVIEPLTSLLLLILLGVVYVGFWLIRPIASVLAQAIRDILSIFQLLPKLPPGPETPLPEAVAAFLKSPFVQTTTRGLAALVVLGAIALIFWLAVRRFFAAPSKEIEETRESIISRALLLAQLKDLLSRRRPPRPAPPLPPYLALTGSPDDPRLMVRRAYQAMLEWARSFNLPRAAGQTPAVYAEALARAVPKGKDSITTLTRAYVGARYGAEAPSREEARNAEAAAAELQKLTSLERASHDDHYYLFHPRA